MQVLGLRMVIWGGAMDLKARPHIGPLGDHACAVEGECRAPGFGSVSWYLV